MEIKMVDVSKIRPDPHNPRKGHFNQEDLQNMALTYHTHSVIQPIEIDEKNTIIIGELRWRAAQIAGLKQIPVIYKKGLSKYERLERQLIENIHRQKVDLADCRDELKTLLMSINKVSTGGRPASVSILAKKLGISTPYLCDILGLDNASDSIKKALDNKEISTHHAIHIQHAPKEIQSGLLKLSKTGTTERDIREIKNKLKEFPEPEQRKEELERIIQRKEQHEYEFNKDLEIAKGKREPEQIIEIESDYDKRLLDKYYNIKNDVFGIVADHIKKFKNDKNKKTAIRVLWEIYYYTEKELRKLGEIKEVEV